MALTGTGDNVLRLHTYAPFTLLRGAIENASTAVWVMTGSNREERVARHLRHELTSAKKLKKVLSEAGETIAPGTHEREKNLLAIANSYGVKRSKVAKEVTATEIVRSASESAGFKSAEMDLVLVYWKLCSAIAHGDRGYLHLFEKKVVGRLRPGVLSVVVTAPTNYVLSGSRGAVAMIETARHLATQRGTSHL